MTQDPEHSDTYVYDSSFGRERSACPPTEPTGQPVGASIADSHTPEGAVSSSKGIVGSPPGDDQVDLTKYGLPEALTKINQVLPEILEFTMNSSVENIISQVAAERELRWHLHEEESRKLHGDSERADDEAVGRGADKGKAIERRPALSTASDGLYTPSEPSDPRLLSTPPPTEATASLPSTEMASPGTKSGFESLPETTASPEDPTTASTGPRGVSSSSLSPSNPKRRNLLRSVFRRLSDGEPCIGLLRPHSTGDLNDHPDLRTRLKKTKLILSRTRETRECISCFDEFAPRDLVKLRCHNYCKPCFRRLITNALETESQWPPRCCLNPVEHKTCLRNISGALSVQYMQKRLEYSTPIHARYYCPLPDCGLFVPTDEANTPFRRAKCRKGHLTCMDCREAPHADAAQCVKNQGMELVQRLAEEEGWRRCHRCHTMIEHATACRHMRCRCGAQFCMVCGAAWWTCGCTERQLDEMKRRGRLSAERRRAREERELREARELERALGIIATAEAGESEKLERARAAREARRKSHVTSSYAELSAQMGEVNELQRGVLEGQHDRHLWDLHAQIQTAKKGLAAKRLARTEELRAAGERRIEEKEKGLWEEYKAGPPPRETVEDTNDERTETRPDGESPGQEDGEAGDGWSRYRDRELEQFRWVVEQEQAVELQHMRARAGRILASFGAQLREMRAKARSDLRWYELVVAERTRLLEWLMAAELEDEIVGDDDDRWDAFEVQEAGEPGPSRHGPSGPTRDTT